MRHIGFIFCEKIPTWLRATNFCINCTTSPRFAPSFMQLRSDPKCTRTLWNAPKHEFRVQWGGSGALVAKNDNVTSCHGLLHYLHQFCLICNKFHVVTKRSQMHQNTTKQTEALVYCPMGQIGCVFCEKNPTWLRATNFCINCTTSHRFAPSFMQVDQVR